MDVAMIVAELGEGSSHEKINRGLGLVQQFEPEDEEAARKLQVLGALVPLVAGALPEDAEELDRYLLAGAQLFVALRSDTASAVSFVENYDYNATQPDEEPEQPDEEPAEATSTGQHDVEVDR